MPFSASDKAFLEMLFSTFLQQTLSALLGGGGGSTDALAAIKQATLTEQADANLTWERLDVVKNQLIFLTLQFQQSQQVLNQLANAPPQPISLPPTPPPGYGGASSGSIASDVWAYVEPGSSQPQGYWQVRAGRFATQLSNDLVAFINPYAPTILGQTDWAYEHEDSGTDGWPDPSVDAILNTDTRLTWLERESGYSGWALGGGGYYSVDGTPLYPDYVFYCILSEREFVALRDGAGAGPSVVVPPVWPGLLGVTVSAATPLSDGLVISRPMDGIIVHLTSVPPYSQKVFYGAVENWAHLGALSFQSDNGLQEEFQYLGFADVVYCPRVLERAHGVVFRTKPGVVGTVQTWLKV